MWASSLSLSLVLSLSLAPFLAGKIHRWLQRGCYESLDLVDLPGSSLNSEISSAAEASRKGSSSGVTSSAMFDPVFGPIGRSPLEREAVLNIEVCACWCVCV